MSARVAAVRVGLASVGGVVFAMQIAHAQPAPAAPDPATLAAAEQLVRDTGGDAHVNKVLDMMRGVYVRMLQQHGQDPDAAAKVVDEVLLPALRAHLPELQQQYAALYAMNASLADLQALHAFYRSPLGLKAIDLQDKMAPRIIVLTTDWARRITPEVLKAKADLLRQRGITQ